MTTPYLSEPRLYRLRLIDDLHRKGLNNRGIADYLNQRGILSPRGGSYSPKLVWVTHKKYLRRKERLKDTTYTIDEVYPVVLTKDSPEIHYVERKLINSV